MPPTTEAAAANQAGGRGVRRDKKGRVRLFSDQITFGDEPPEGKNPDSWGPYAAVMRLGTPQETTERAPVGVEEKRAVSSTARPRKAWPENHQI